MDKQRRGSPIPPEKIHAYAAGDDSVAEVLCSALQPPVHLAVLRFLPEDDLEADDVLQETLIAVLKYLRADRGFNGNLVKFAVTIAKNRCRDLLRARKRQPRLPLEPLAFWIEDPSRSPLDELLQQEIRELLQAALDRMRPACQDLFKALYVDQLSAEEIRRRAGLKSVQGVFYRRNACLAEALEIFKNRLGVRSVGEGSEP